MSSEREQVRFPLRRVALLGGGRWSRVLLPVMQSLLVEDAEIVWVTKHGFEHARQWLSDKAIERVLLQTDIDWRDHHLDAAVVATSPATHGQQVAKLLEHRIPTFCEKPFTLDYEEAMGLVRIAAEVGCPLGVNLEMYFASYIEDFADATQDRNVRSIEITWLDPWSESRYGEIKHGDVYTSIIDDMWPHCWSLLRRIRPDWEIGLVEDVHYEPSTGRVEILVRVQEILVAVLLSRRSERRVRKIDVNHGEVRLDFSAEPGSMEIDGLVKSNEWRGLRPLTRSLSSFFEVALEPRRAANWPLSSCVDAVQSAQSMSGKLKVLQQQQLESLREGGVDFANVGHRNLIVDLLLPEFAIRERRWPAITMEDQIAFARHVCANQGIPYK